MFAELAQNCPNIHAEILLLLALARLKEKGFTNQFGESSRKQLYTLVNLEWIITEKSQDDYFNPPSTNLIKLVRVRAPPKKSKVKQVKQLPQNKSKQITPSTKKRYSVPTK